MLCISLETLPNGALYHQGLFGLVPNVVPWRWGLAYPKRSAMLGLDNSLLRRTFVALDLLSSLSNDWYARLWTPHRRQSGSPRTLLQKQWSTQGITGLPAFCVRLFFLRARGQLPSSFLGLDAEGLRLLQGNAPCLRARGSFLEEACEL